MSDTPQTTPQPTPAAPARRRRNPIARVIKAIVIAIIALLLLLIAAVGVAVCYLSPERLTPIVNSIASEQLDATVEAKRVELTFWKSFPRLKLDIDSLSIVSHSLNGVSADVRSQLPQNADSLLTLQHLHGGIDILSLLASKIHLYDVELTRPTLNIVEVDSLVNNYNIFPPSEEKKTKEPLSIPDITINRFAILDEFPATYTSLATDTRLRVLLATGELNGVESPVYNLRIDGDGSGALGKFHLPATAFGMNGNIHWSADNPGAMGVENLVLSAEKVALKFDANMQLLDTMAINTLKVEGRDIAVADVISLIPTDYRGELSKLRTNLKVSFDAKLLDRYVANGGPLPRVEVNVDIPRESLEYDKLKIPGLRLAASGIVDLGKPDRTTITVRELSTEGNAMKFTLKADIATPLSDPSVKGTFDGTIDFSKLPDIVVDKLPLTVSGTLTGDADFRFRLSQLTPKAFHKVALNGNLSLANFDARMKDGSAELYTRHADLKFGSSNSVTINGVSVDSLLTASLTIDTIAAGIPGLHLTGAGLSIGAGARNVTSSTDSTQINPLGASIKAKRLSLRADSDSIRLRLTDATVRATLQRYNGDARAPMLKLGISTGRLRIADIYNRFSLSDASVDIMLHPKGRPQMSRNMQAVYDSIAAARPGLSSDSIMRLARRSNMARAKRTAHAKTASKGERLDFGLDNSLKSWLRLWQVKGEVKARQARMFTPVFPVRNTISDLNLTFSTDSIHLHNTRYRMNHSNFLINGSINNISRALTSRRGVPLQINLDVRCDSLNINEITRAMMMGSKFSERLAQGKVKLSDTESDEAMERAITHQVDSNARAAVLIPTNIEAHINVSARNMKYGDIKFQRFTGEIEAKDGAVHLKRLGAYTPMGSFGMTALYNAPTVEDLSFAGGIVIRRLDLHEFLNMLPEIDSIMPMLRTMEGIITAECAMSSELDSMMNIKFHTLQMALKLSGDSLVLLDNDTFRKISKWLLFKHKDRNMIDSMSVELAIHNSMLDLYPFMIDLDRYRFGISGSNDASLNLNYHIAVLKSPIPFKFGINIKGTPKHIKIGLGRARFNENEVASRRSLTDTARINLINEIQNVFRFGLKNSKHRKLTLQEPRITASEFNVPDTISAADSLFFIRQGVLPKPAGWVDPDSIVPPKEEKKKHKFLGIF